MKRIGIIGAGAWGTALALVLARTGREIALWAHEREVADAINDRRENPLYLPGIALGPGIRAVAELDTIGAVDAVLLVTPAQHLRSLAERLAPHIPPTTPLMVCAKGIEQGTGELMSEVVASVLPQAQLAVLSGPSFAVEVARGLPTALTLAARDRRLGTTLLHGIADARFRPYLSDDIVGTEIGGAVKNVIAIACGIVIGRKLGDNARAALITRGLAEMARLGLAKGAKIETFMGLSGLGDLTLTCNAMQSRNYSLGVALGQGRRLADILAERRSVAEGVMTAISVTMLARQLHVDMPISRAVNAILHDGANIDETVEALLARPFKGERLDMGVLDRP